MSPNPSRDPRFKRYRIAVYAIFLGALGFFMTTMMISVIRHTFF